MVVKLNHYYFNMVFTNGINMVILLVRIRKRLEIKMEKVEEIIKEAIRILEDYNSSSMLSRDQSRYKCIDFLKTNFDIKDG